MSRKILVDTCVFIDAFDENSQNYDISYRFLDWTVENEIIITMPAHAWFEIWCTLRRLERIDKTFKGRPIKGKRAYPIELIHINQVFIEKYGNVDIRYIKSGDHIFIAVAKVDGYPIITTDSKMRDVAREEGIQVFNPEGYMNLIMKSLND
jgi:predicted nucleic acid-binding protein